MNSSSEHGKLVDYVRDSLRSRGSRPSSSKSESPADAAEAKAQGFTVVDDAMRERLRHLGERLASRKGKKERP